jgi:hypothetical protein
MLKASLDLLQSGKGRSNIFIRFDGFCPIHLVSLLSIFAKEKIFSLHYCYYRSFSVFALDFFSIESKAFEQII